MKTRLQFLFFQLLLTTILTLNAYGQSPGKIQGSVTDSTHAKISGAQLTLRSDTGLQLATSTDQNGAFQFNDLIPGTYYLEVKAAGFSLYAADQVRLTRGEERKLDIVLEIAAIATGSAVRRQSR